MTDYLKSTNPFDLLPSRVEYVVFEPVSFSRNGRIVGFATKPFITIATGGTWWFAASEGHTFTHELCDDMYQHIVDEYPDVIVDKTVFTKEGSVEVPECVISK